MTLEGRQMIQENRLCKLINCIFLRIYFNTEISIGETKVTKSCKVNTPVNTNHLPQNLKKRYRFSLAIVVPQSGSNSHSGDRLFEWPKLSNRARRKVSKFWRISILSYWLFRDTFNFLRKILKYQTDLKKNNNNQTSITFNNNVSGL